MSKQVFEAIESINELFKVEKDGNSSFIKYDATFDSYCPIPKYLDKQECSNYEHIVSSGFIALLTLFKDVDDEKYIESDILAEYAILWLIYKLNQKEKNKWTDLNEFYKTYIMNNEKNINETTGSEAYKIYKDIINNKICSNTINIEEASKLYEAFEILCKMYNELDNDAKNCTKCLEDAKKFFSKYNDLNKDSKIPKDCYYYQVWQTLSTGYDTFKKKCNNEQSIFSSLPTIEKIQLPENCSEEHSVQSIVQSTVLSPEAASSSSSIASKLIPSLLTFGIPVFFGISYKYSLFGIDKLFQRQYIRKELKKIKKKMKLNI
ncbi:hypothetical protein YYE_04754 [Plasmodium vinckei vinckei]|uniref:CIR protein PIR protein n=1 Tax=Plasmodium vinckei vinckei TaxID=54757 RepID=A0A081IA62_PLAVN|nr:hypothetical protein YYE_04754 [Plasmodium vinckei vinckei]